MHTIAVLALAALLAGCATPAERAAQAERRAEEMIVIYGPACEKLGYKTGTDPWRDCVLRLDAKDRLDRYHRAASTTCMGHGGFFNCTGC